MNSWGWQDGKWTIYTAIFLSTAKKHFTLTHLLHTSIQHFNTQCFFLSLIIHTAGTAIRGIMF